MTDDERRSKERGEADETLLLSTVTTPDGTVISVGDFLKQQGTEMFTEGTTYTREEIHDQVGGDRQSYLPNIDGAVVAACLDRSKNPDAPDVILPGTGDKRESTAEMLVNQKTAVPTFIKRGTNQWEYVGHYRAVRAMSDPSEIKGHAEKSGRDDITQVIYMEPAVPG